jgi:hypothetical protein
MSFSMEIALLHVVMIDFVPKQLPGQRNVRVQIVGVRDRLEVGRKELDVGVSDDTAKGRVHFKKAAIQIDHGDPDRGMIEYLSKRSSFSLELTAPGRRTLLGSGHRLSRLKNRGPT